MIITNSLNSPDSLDNNNTAVDTPRLPFAFGALLSAGTSELGFDEVSCPSLASPRRRRRGAGN